MTEMSDELREHLWNRRWDILHRIKLSVLYHHKRERFFDAVDKFILAATAFSASAAFALVLKQFEDTKADVYVSALTAALAMISMAYTPSLKAKQHANLAADFKRLLADCEKAGERWTEEQCADFASRTVLIEAGEPAQLGALVVQCENEIAMAAGQRNKVRALPLHKAMLMHFINFDVTGLQADLRKPV